MTMTDRPILFSAPMVRALLDGRKTQTRRVLPTVHPRFPQHNQIRTDVLIFDPAQPEVWYWDGKHEKVGASYPLRFALGNRLWVREASATWEGSYRDVVYRADVSDQEWSNLSADARNGAPWKRRPSIHMPRWASRLTLIVTDVRVQRLQDISEADAVAEGVGLFDAAETARLGVHIVRAVCNDCRCASHIDAMRETWAYLHGVGAWSENPWVVVPTFTVQRGNIDQMEAA